MRMRGGLIVEETPSLRVRRLTPSVCARLQGFPVGHTDIPCKTNSPYPRYRAIGNSMPVPVMKWLGERIDQAILTNVEPDRRQTIKAPGGAFLSVSGYLFSG
ncbi:DNA cytosine methyltransferase [Salmonella enterica]